MFIIEQLKWELERLKEVLPMSIKEYEEKYKDIPSGYIKIKKIGYEKYGYIRYRKDGQIREKYIGNVNTSRFFEMKEILNIKKQKFQDIEEDKRQIEALEFAVNTIMEREKAREEKKRCQEL